MSAIPPKHTPEPPPYDAPESGGLVAMYNAASHAGAESFPVLKAFQDYIEAERTQARKRVVQLSILFAVLMGVVVTGFLGAGAFMLRHMSAMQNKLLDVALAAKAAPAAPVAAPVSQPVAAPQPAPDLAQAVTELQSGLDKKLDGVSAAIASQVSAKVASQNGELQALRDELKTMREQSAQLKSELTAIRTEPPKPASPAPLTPPRPTPVASAPAASVAAAPAVPAQETPDPRYPTPTKAPPETPASVTPPAPPNGLMATAVPLKTKNLGSVPWRVLIPE